MQSHGAHGDPQEPSGHIVRPRGVPLGPVILRSQDDLALGPACHPELVQGPELCGVHCLAGLHSLPVCTVEGPVLAELGIQGCYELTPNFTT